MEQGGRKEGKEGSKKRGPGEEGVGERTESTSGNDLCLLVSSRGKSVRFLAAAVWCIVFGLTNLDLKQHFGATMSQYVSSSIRNILHHEML